jgi:predicted CopG family antitoxin
LIALGSGVLLRVIEVWSSHEYVYVLKYDSRLSKNVMQQKMTITIDREVYDALYRVVGKGNISKFLENLARPHVLKEDLASAYQAMAADTERELEALEWSNGLIGSVNDA